MELKNIRTCARCRAFNRETGICSLGFLQSDGCPAERCPKPLSAAELKRCREEQESGNRISSEEGNAPAEPPKDALLEKESVLEKREDMSCIKSVYLIDTENVGREWVSYVEKNQPNAEYILFCTDKSPALPLEYIPKIANAISRIRCVECYRTGPNSLDFQLVTLLGSLVEKDPTEQYIILSHDTGFDAAVLFWRERRINVIRKEPDQQMSEKKEAETVETPQPVDKKESKGAKAFVRRLVAAGVPSNLPGLDELALIMANSTRFPKTERLANIYAEIQRAENEGKFPGGQKLYNSYKKKIKSVIRGDF